MTNCLFCKIINKEIPADIIYEDDSVIAFLDIAPVNPGHTLLIPKKHATDILDSDPQSLSDLIKVSPKISKAVIDSVNATGFNFYQNNGEVAGQAVLHLHFHIIPRFEGDGHELFKGTPMEFEKLKQIAEKIKTKL